MGLISGLSLPAISFPLSNKDSRLQYMQIRVKVALQSF